MRPYRVVIRNLHPSTPTCIIKEEIEATGNTVVGEIINAKFGPEKKPTSTFFVNLAAGSNNRAVKDLRYIYHQSIVIEDPKKRKSIVQCQRCQQYGHSKNYCMRPYRCVKCGLSHKTSECQKRDRLTPAICALCNGPHPANYKGCEVYKEILARRTRMPSHNVHMPRKVLNSGDGTSTNMLGSVTKERTQSTKTTFAEVLRQNKEQHTAEIKTGPNPTLEQLLHKQTEKFECIFQQMSTLISLITKLVDRLTK